MVLAGAAPLFGAKLSADTLPVTTLPGDPVTASIRNLQRKADRAFERGQFERAYRVYLKNLAPKGDKHAHYMIGHHYAQGLGVPRDPARALAWFALAAERGSVNARAMTEQLAVSLSPPERQRADEILGELSERYGDRRLQTKALRRDMRELRKRTGSLVGGGTSPTRVITENGTVEGGQFYALLEARIELRTQILGGNVTLGELELIDAPEDEAEDTPENDQE